MINWKKKKEKKTTPGLKSKKHICPFDFEFCNLFLLFIHAFIFGRV